MRFYVFLMRHQGKLVPRWQLYQGKHHGDLHITDVHDTVLHRTCRTAQLLPGAATQPTKLVLYDAALVWMCADQFTLTGFERFESLGGIIDYAQTWLCESGP